MSRHSDTSIRPVAEIPTNPSLDIAPFLFHLEFLSNPRKQNRFGLGSMDTNIAIVPMSNIYTKLGMLAIHAPACRWFLSILAMKSVKWQKLQPN